MYHLSLEFQNVFERKLRRFSTLRINISWKIVHEERTKVELRINNVFSFRSLIVLQMQCVLMSNHNLELPLRIGENRTDEDKRNECTAIACEALLPVLTE